MNNPVTLVDKIRWQCHLLRDEPALVLPDATSPVTYAQLDRHLNSASLKLSQMGVVPGAVYGLLVKDHLLHLVLSLALEELGAGTMQIFDLNIPTTWPFAAILCDRDIGDSSWPSVRVDGGWLECEGRPPERRDESAPSPDDICRICLTSGSTGVPKAVVFSHSAWQSRISRYEYSCGRFSSLQTLMNFLVGGHYRYSVHALSRGTLFCFPDSTVERTARKIAAYKVQSLCAAASTLAKMIAGRDRNAEEFASVRMIRCTGSHVPRQLAEKVRDVTGARILNTYGTLESGMIASAWVDTLDLEHGEVGTIVPGTAVDIVDPETRLPSSGRGALRIRSVSLASGYWGGDPARSFDGGGFYTNDIGSISADGRITLEGRTSNVVNLGGDKATLERIELSYAGAPGIRELAAVPIRDDVGLTQIVAVIVPNDQWSEQKMWDHFRRNLPRTFWPMKIVVADDLPRGGGGKIDRSRLGTLVGS